MGGNKSYKVYEDEIEVEKTENAERQKTSLPKEQAENTDFSKPVLNKIMTTGQSRVRYNFVAPLKTIVYAIKIQQLNSATKYKTNLTVIFHL